MLTDYELDQIRDRILTSPLVDAIQATVDGLRGGPVADPEVMADALLAALPRLSDTAVAKLAHAYSAELVRRDPGAEPCSGGI